MDLLSRLVGRDVSFWGRNAVAGTGWEELYAYDQPLDWNAILSPAAKVDVTSSSASDTNTAGTGARTIRLVGLDANKKLQYEDLALNGQTIVISALSYLRLFGAEVLTAGSGGVNAGDIHIVKTGTGGTYTNGVPGTLTSALCKMLIGENSAMNGMFSAPAGEHYQVMGLWYSSRAQAAKFGFFMRPHNGILVMTHPFEIAASFGDYVDLEKFNITVKERSDFLIRVQGQAASAVASAICQLKRV